MDQRLWIALSGVFGGKHKFDRAVFLRRSRLMLFRNFLKYPDTFAIRPFKKYGKNLLISKDSAVPFSLRDRQVNRPQYRAQNVRLHRQLNPCLTTTAKKGPPSPTKPGHGVRREPGVASSRASGRHHVSRPRAHGRNVSLPVSYLGSGSEGHRK